MQNKTNKSIYLFLMLGVLLNLVFPQYSWAYEQIFILPDAYETQTQTTRLEVNLSRRRVFVYRGKNLIKSYPIAVGRRNWETPTGKFKVQQLLQNPTWIHPITGQAIKGGTPENPLGNYWIGFWTDGRNWVGFHGTPNPETVGQAISHGCLRMYNRDIKELFQLVTFGTSVNVIK
ncbi:L,D-transpeptidase [Chlorogloeopsis sp. ULAP01]|uniref:L,D-transpeptidase n=1 Tax=Chlorogloeopsis sp. ULAP01 TaxID=3056483 RepID=UPI0025AB1B65|nr:L,D-transpeptidase [Chlorogloeopsis sp. ULAP01]MDM9383148.1 L,D-transpeptidase [Chlorogloeopsis sp. ULAP01]